MADETPSSFSESDAPAGERSEPTRSVDGATGSAGTGDGAADDASPERPVSAGNSDATGTTDAASDSTSGASDGTRGGVQTVQEATRHEASRQSPQPARPGYGARTAGSGSVFTVDRIVRFVLGAAAMTAVGWVLWYFAGLVVYLVVGGVFAYLLRPIVDRFQGLGLGRVPAILLTFAVVFSVASVAVTSIVPFMAQQVREISQLVSVDAAVDVADYIETRLRTFVPIEEGILVQNIRQLADTLLSTDLVEGETVAETVSSVVAVFTNILYAVIIVPFITFFFLKDGVQIRRSLLRLVPNRYFEVTLAILDKVEANIGRYFRALLVQSTSIAVIASSLLWLIGLQNPVAIGVFTGLANTIPYFGPFLGFLGGSLVGIAQTGNFTLVPGVAIAMGLTQLADNVLLQPIIFSRAAQAHPLVILFVVLIGAQLAGIVGMLIAIPLATTVRVVVEQVLWSLRNYRTLQSG